MLFVLFHPLSLYIYTYIYSYARTRIFLGAFFPLLRYFHPISQACHFLAKLVSVCGQKGARSDVCVRFHNGVRPWSVDWRRFACKRKTFHLPRWPVGEGGGKFSRTTDAGPPLIALIPILHSFLPVTSALFYRKCRMRSEVALRKLVPCGNMYPCGIRDWKSKF